LNAAERKQALREEALRARDALAPAEIEERSAEITRRVMLLSSYRRARVRLLFASIGSEVRTDRLIAHTVRSRARLVLPRVRGPEEALALHEVVDPETQLVPGWSGIPEPIAGNCPECTESDIDFILVPGLAFDRHGGRLGYGGGYYDYILNVRGDLVDSGAAVAVAFASQIVDEVPREAWDVRVSVIVTEDGVIDARSDRS